MKKPAFIFLNTLFMMGITIFLTGLLLANISSCVQLQEKTIKLELGMHTLRNYLENDTESANFKINKQLEVVKVADKNIKKIILQVIDKKKDKAVVNLIYYEE